MSENMRLYNALRAVPDIAKKNINAGRLKGMTDVNPMFRIKALTACFGPCGIGWWYTIDKQWMETGAEGEIAAFCDISLYYRDGDVVSQGIPGTGGSMFVANERSGPHTSDECYKMALTDAISVAAKAIGVAADVYWDKDRTKYDRAASDDQNPICACCKKPINGIASTKGSMTGAEVARYTQEKSNELLCWGCYKKKTRSYERVDAYEHEDAGDRI